MQTLQDQNTRDQQYGNKNKDGKSSLIYTQNTTLLQKLTVKELQFEQKKKIIMHTVTLVSEEYINKASQ